MDILLYLSELLKQRNSIGLIGLGTFFKKKFAGRYDKEKQSFLPPGYSLQFTTEVKDEELLPNYIAESRNISKDGAAYYISRFVEETHKKLEIEHEAELENIGRLFYTEHEGLSFEPSKNINYGSEFFGLPAIAESEVIPEFDLKAKPSGLQENEGKKSDEIAHEPAEDRSFPAEEILPVIENVELDEVKDDLRQTLSNYNQEIEKDSETQDINVPDSVIEQHEEHPYRFGHQPESEIPKINADLKDDTKSEEVVKEAPQFIKEQHEEYPNRFGHQPESEEENKSALSEDEIKEEPIIEAPEFIKEQHEEHPNRFGHQPESEEPKTYIILEDEIEKEPIIDAPEFIKEQHAEHPNRFGHDPIAYEVLEEDENKSAWTKVWIALFVLILVAVVLYFVKPDWFGNSPKVQTSALSTTAVDTSKSRKIDPAKIKQDSIAKTDSILKANQVTGKLDTVNTKTNVSNVKTSKTAPTSSFHVISVSYATEAAAQRYIDKVKKIGLNAIIAKMEGKRKKVSIASFATREEAEKEKNILQKRLKGEGFYVKEIKNNTQP
ncbi:SPOR domain-containing protein [Pedobacter sp. Leaf176]|uniref:SPOR domain-containing protein n=1 Tax=Pedobacter sp. Leaf176 TaxID=1736286 RepID=UPI0006FAD9BB|nr:SPOR domain-containing protein [Pedobacter sp. Leaf176]KQR71457.1 hypothetical protein ASF92_08785 [Pedobacter sp. Leaf176]